MKPDFLVGLDLGGTSVKGVALTPSGERLASRVEPFDLEREGAFAQAVETALARLEAEVGGTAARVGLSAPGIAAADARSIAFMPGRFPGLAGLDWSARLGRSPVPVLNDAQAALLGEVWLGAARGARNVALITLGTGVGGAAMADGRLLRGHCGKAGHLGHISLDPEGAPDITGTPGSLEDAIGNHNVRARSGGRFETTHALVRAAEQGDVQAREIWTRSVRALAAAIVSITNVLDPEIVIIGGGIGASGPTLLEPLRERVSELEWKVCGHEARIVAATLGDLAGAFGAARFAVQWAEDAPDGARPLRD